MNKIPGNQQVHHETKGSMHLVERQTWVKWIYVQIFKQNFKHLLSFKDIYNTVSS